MCQLSAQLEIPGFRYCAETKSTYGVNIHLKVQLTVTPKKVKNLTGDTKWHSKFQPNMISSFGAILAWKSDDDVDADVADTDDNYDDDRNSDPYMSPSYAGDTNTVNSDSIYLFHHMIHLNSVISAGASVTMKHVTICFKNIVHYSFPACVKIMLSNCLSMLCLFCFSKTVSGLKEK